MNPQDAHGWLGILLAIPLPAWAALAAFTIAAVLPWLAEFAVPGEWSDNRSRLALYGIAVIAGPPAAVSIWHTWAALTAGFAAALAAQFAREVAGRRYPWLSPRQTVVRRNPQGQVVGIKEGDDPTILVRVETTQPNPQQSPPKP